MQLHIANNLKTLRKARQLTQEELAGILGVTYQAVSKWERGEGCPDIALLPGIATCFGITLDTLFGMEDIRGKARLEEYHAQWKQCNGAGSHEAGVELMRKALRDFPGESLLTVQLVTSLEKCSGTPEACAEYRREAIALSERLAKDENPEIRNAFLFNLCHSHWKNGDSAKAMEGARKLPGFYKTRENALVLFLQGEEKLRQGRQGLLDLTGSLFHQCFAMAEALAPAEAISLLQACCGAAQALYPCNCVPELMRLQATANFRMAKASLRLGCLEDAMTQIQRSVALAADCRKPAAGPHSLLAEGLDAAPVSVSAWRNIGLEHMKEDALFLPLWEGYPTQMKEMQSRIRHSGKSE